ncbi:GNAT family N-acetyltransferase [Pontibacter ramchanderi]|uniref:Ribosomal-protein-serine acetyltransferase n=1 Tax=Pontibacter ramchanderi TaxID=1179743 RepID=A0A2N3UAC0_9BACT|nr:GNAT family protein [Pontibacter ramchanderi]PKV66324.1 ribosomal-protein-serine acetyltransferase [Pontibacter ramchanderi]
MKTAAAPKQLTVAPDINLHEAQVSDAAALYQLIDSGRLYLREWLPFIDFSQSASDTELYLRSVTAPGNLQDKVYIIRYQEQVAGIIGYKTIDRVNCKLEIGYWLGESFQGKAIMVRSCQALIKHAFEYMRMNRIQIKVGVGNTKSSRIPQRLGFQLEGIERAGEWLRGQFIDLEVYSLLKQEWLEQKPTSGPGGNDRA